MGKLFGTDGIRGIANTELTPEMAFKLGLAVVHVLQKESGSKRPRVVVGKDTRVSGDMLEAAVCAGICAGGGDAVCAGVLPTPAVAYLTIKKSMAAGIMISASHNTSEYNGIKVFGPTGFKLPDAVEDEVERLMDDWRGLPRVQGGEVGSIVSDASLRTEYVKYIRGINPVPANPPKILIDCANGSASATAAEIFADYNPEIMCSQPDGININDNCGSTHIDRLAKLTAEGGYDLGIAFDGDADRCLLVDEKGGMIDGDKIICVLAARMKAEGALKKDTVVVTVMSNIGLHRFASGNGVNVEVTTVGDRYVLENMLENGYNLGGEQSGHIILTDHATTGDGQLTAVCFLKVFAESGKPASELASLMRSYPQVLQNVRVASGRAKAIAADPDVLAEVGRVEAILGGNGRVLLRPSGTEPLVRVMLEGENEAELAEYAGRIAAVIAEKAGK